MSIARGGAPCDCWDATIRIVSQCEAPFKNSSYAQQLVREMSLSERLNLGQKLVQQWETMNGCVSFEDHLNPQLMRIMTDAISRVLAIYEMTTAGMHRVAGNVPRNHSSFSCSSSPVFVGGVKVEDPEEIAIIGQEALRHSVIRLGAMLQDIEEETRPYGPEDLSDVEQLQQDSEVKELIGRLFRLLGKINELAS
jgi:hypothetical protein